METVIENIYKPYDFTKYRCYVISLPVNINGYMRIEQKMPEYIKNIKGIFVSVSCPNSLTRMAGFISLNFNGQALKSYQAMIARTNLLRDCSHPIAFDETIIPNSLMQGFYYDAINTVFGYPYTLSIYIHYQEERK